MDDSKEKIEELERLKAAAAMTPQEIAKKIEEAQRAAEEALSKMTPEQRAEAEEKAKKMIEESERKNREIVEEAQRFLADRAPKFCSNCGTPNKGFKFCPNCGNKLA